MIKAQLKWDYPNTFFFSLDLMGDKIFFFCTKEKYFDIKATLTIEDNFARMSKPRQSIALELKFNDNPQMKNLTLTVKLTHSQKYPWGTHTERSYNLFYRYQKGDQFKLSLAQSHSPHKIILEWKKSYDLNNFTLIGKLTLNQKSYNLNLSYDNNDQPPNYLVLCYVSN